MLQRLHIKSGRTQQVSPGLAETGAMTGAVPLLLMRIPLQRATQKSVTALFQSRNNHFISRTSSPHWRSRYVCTSYAGSYRDTGINFDVSEQLAPDPVDSIIVCSHKRQKKQQSLCVSAITVGASWGTSSELVCSHPVRTECCHDCWPRLD